MAEPTLVLRSGRERSLRRRHPWVFSGAVARVEGEATPGGTVAVRAAGGELLARAAWSPVSQIAARVWTFDPAEEVDEAFLARRIERAAARRAALAERTNAMRLVFGESDGLPGLVADRYGPVVVAQLSSAGAERWREPIVAALARLAGVTEVVVRADPEARRKEGLPVSPAPASRRLELREGAWRFVADVAGQKTGFYLDQRDSRAVVSALGAGRRVLDVFSYSGGFAVAAGTAGATELVLVDSSRPALALADENLRLNGLSGAEVVVGDAFEALRRLDRRFDLVVLDPPKLAKSEAQVQRAARAYKDANLHAMRLLAPDGYLVTFSCSGLVSEELFQKIVFGAALDAGREVWIERRLCQPPDHPVLLAVPEAAYLKGFVCRVA